MWGKIVRNRLVWGILLGILAGLGIFLLYRHFAAVHGRVLNIYCWDTSFRTLMENYYPAYHKDTQYIGEVKVHWHIIPGTDNIYQTTIDKALADAEDITSDERVDMFLVEADYVRKYTGNDEVTQSLEELGITEPELAEQFPYTRRAAMDTNGIQRGISWQACPGVMIYRRDIARQVFGTDDPAQIQSLVRNWPGFEQTALQLRGAGYHMLAGYYDTYRVFSSNVSAPWINSQTEIVLDPAMQQWREQTRNFIANGSSYSNNLWEQGWNAQVRGDVFCYFGPAWMMEHALKILSLKTPVSEGGREEKGNGTFGQWAVCQGPQPYFWGGTWICAAKNSDNSALIADIMRTLCCRQDTAKAMAVNMTEFANHRSAMEELAADPSFGMPFLSGQNAYAVMAGVADSIRVENMTPYDQGAHEAFQAASREYFDGQISREASWQKFLATVWLKYPELQSASLVR